MGSWPKYILGVRGVAVGDSRTYFVFIRGSAPSSVPFHIPIVEKLHFFFFGLFKLVRPEKGPNVGWSLPILSTIKTPPGNIATFIIGRFKVIVKSLSIVTCQLIS